MRTEHDAEAASNPLFLRAAMDAWGDTVLRLAMCRMQNRGDAEDVFQSVFLKLYEHTGSFKDDGHLKAWLLRVTINCCNDLHRKVRFSRNTSLEHADEIAAPEKDDFSFLDEGIDRLPENQRVAIHLYYFARPSIWQSTQTRIGKPT